MRAFRRMVPLRRTFGAGPESPPPPPSLSLPSPFPARRYRCCSVVVAAVVAAVTVAAVTVAAAFRYGERAARLGVGSAHSGSLRSATLRGSLREEDSVVDLATQSMVLEIQVGTQASSVSSPWAQGAPFI